MPPHPEFFSILKRKKLSVVHICVRRRHQQADNTPPAAQVVTHRQAGGRAGVKKTALLKRHTTLLSTRTITKHQQAGGKRPAAVYKERLEKRRAGCFLSIVDIYRTSEHLFIASIICREQMLVLTNGRSLSAEPPPKQNTRYPLPSTEEARFVSQIRPLPFLLNASKGQPKC